MSINFCTFNSDEEVAWLNLATVMVGRLEGKIWVGWSGAMYGNFIGIAFQYVAQSEHGLMSSTSLQFL
jgi:hypothetical protein